MGLVEAVSLDFLSHFDKNQRRGERQCKTCVIFSYVFAPSSLWMVKWRKVSSDIFRMLHIIVGVDVAPLVPEFKKNEALPPIQLAPAVIAADD